MIKPWMFAAAGAVVVLLLLGAAPSRADDAHAPISEATYVEIGGIKQWITIKGDDRSNPVVLILHGGPGSTTTPFGGVTYGSWTHDFTVVQWDQRGAGRTYSQTGPSIAPTMTIDRMAEDGIEVSEYVIQRLHKHKIIINGGSWGSILGVTMAHERPDLFYAYLGVAQIVNLRRSAVIAYADLTRMAEAAHDDQTLASLRALGPPPWNALDTWGRFQKLLQPYQLKLAPFKLPPSFKMDAEYSSDAEMATWREAGDFSQKTLFGEKLDGPASRFDIAQVGYDFHIPIFIVQGADDMTAPPQLVKAWLRKVTAPTKRLYLIPHTGHMPSDAESARAWEVLDEEIRPLAMAPS